MKKKVPFDRNNHSTPKHTQSQQLKAHRSAQKQPVLFHRKIGGKNR